MAGNRSLAPAVSIAPRSSTGGSAPPMNVAPMTHTATKMVIRTRTLCPFNLMPAMMNLPIAPMLSSPGSEDPCAFV
jgi:hypothetical protein